mmetsp:Transcript_27655/g.110745  ORF Transcript_27655/g.110745 Transcript_27655/m.110745 type:complete len:383 (-) Transcript_27655:695-1843(-)
MTTSTVRSVLRASMRIGSPSRTRAIGPPSWASGVTWPMQKPCEPPEKRPSVMSAVTSPRPAPMMAEVGVSISGSPGPPLGPSYRMTTTEPGGICFSARAASMASSESKTFAVPVNDSPSLPVILATAPSGQRFPRMIWRCPVGLMGVARGRMTSWNAYPKEHGSCETSTSARFSRTVRPVHVRQSPSRYPSSRRYFMSAGVPPTLWRSSMTYWPDGLRSARKGVLSETRWKSSSVRSRPTERAIAIKWSTAFVEPPVAMTMVIAFSKAARVMICRGVMFFSRSVRIAAPARSRHSPSFSSESAGDDDEYGSAMPSASIAEAMVFAVYMPPHAPRPGHACRTIVCRSSSEILPYAYSPYDWNALTMSSFLSPSGGVPARIVPP